MRPIIYPYKFGSAGARVLSNELRARGHRAKRVRSNGKYTPFQNHLVVNWGNSTSPEWWLQYIYNYGNSAAKILNDPLMVGSASNKLTAFQIMKDAGVQVPEFTTSWGEACGWNREGAIVERNKLTGHSGAGIVFRPHVQGEDIVELSTTCPLFVKYIKKSKEFRVHVFKGKVIDVQQKRKRLEVPSEEVNYQVRNHSNGWVYCRDDISPHQSVLDDAVAAVSALGLDFGAVDIIWNDYYSQGYTLEVNTAPGLEGKSIQLYADAIEELL